MQDYHLNHQEMTKATQQMFDDFFHRIDQLAAITIADTRSALQQNGKNNPDLWVDEIHPTEAGIGIVANHYVDAMLKKHPDLLL